MILRSVGYGTIYTWLVKTHSRVHNEALMVGVFWYCDYPTGSSAFEIWPVNSESVTAFSVIDIEMYIHCLKTGNLHSDLDMHNA